MSSTQLLHRGKKSFWGGTITTLCGLTYPAKGSRSPLFIVFYPKCPACEAIHSNGGR